MECDIIPIYRMIAVLSKIWFVFLNIAVEQGKQEISTLLRIGIFAISVFTSSRGQIRN
jgi:hypothetical protein